ALVGEPGAGKTRLAHEFVRTVEGATVLYGRCQSYGEAITYAPLAQAIRQVSGATAGATPAVLAERIRALVPDEPRAAEFLAAAAGVSATPAAAEEVAGAAAVLYATTR